MSLTLARLPTPLHPLKRLSAELGADIWIKRDDLTGFGLSGNKVRKLDFLMAEALAQGADTVVTTGGIQSNHCRATAVASRQLGLQPTLLLRGSAPQQVEGNLLLDTLLGAEISWCTPEEYRERDSLLARMADDLRAQGRRPYVIPEGGSNALGARGFITACDEVLQQAPDGFDGVVCAVGSGGTLAGLAAGASMGSVYGVAVCDGRQTFADRVRTIASEGAYSIGQEGKDWSVVEGYQGPAYAVAERPVWETIRWLAEHEGILLDPVYTGKAMHALCTEVRAGRWGGRLLFWHTGGAFGLFGRGAELD